MLISILLYILLNIGVLACISLIYYLPFIYLFISITFFSILIYISSQLANFIWYRSHLIYKELNDPTNKAVLISGCDTGFGHLLAQKLHHYGYFVYAGCLKPDGPGAKHLIDTCANLKIIKMDVTKDNEVDEAAKVVSKHLDNRVLWSIVNNAGILISNEIEMGDMKSFLLQMDINCMGIVRVTKAFLPLLRKSKGRVVNIASLAGRYCIPGMVGYSMSKAGVISFSDGLRREMKKWDIDVITIEPHLFRTNLCNDEQQKKCLQQAWENTLESVREDYGECYLKGFQIFLDKILDSARPEINKVVETMMIAVVHQFVSPQYRVMGDLERIRVCLYDFLPVRVLDMICHYLSIMYTGKPALIKAIYEKKKSL